MNQKPSIFVFIGPPGAGKGTLSQDCVRDLGWVQLSTGNLCRRAIQQGTPLSKEIASALKEGRLISDEIINMMVQEWLESQLIDNKTIILDGYPRIKEQAVLLDHFLNKYRDIDVRVVRFVVSDGVVVDRLATRLICTNSHCQKIYTMSNTQIASLSSIKCDTCHASLVKRDDDRLDVVQHRLVVYHKHEKELLEFYQATGQPIIDLLCNESSEKVFERFCAIIGGIA